MPDPTPVSDQRIVVTEVRLAFGTVFELVFKASVAAALIWAVALGLWWLVLLFRG